MHNVCIGDQTLQHACSDQWSILPSRIHQLDNFNYIMNLISFRSVKCIPLALQGLMGSVNWAHSIYKLQLVHWYGLLHRALITYKYRDPPIMLKILPIMLCCTDQKLCPLCSIFIPVSCLLQLMTVLLEYINLFLRFIKQYGRTV